jgi:hypothetical protein
MKGTQCYASILCSFSSPFIKGTFTENTCFTIHTKHIGICDAIWWSIGIIKEREREKCEVIRCKILMLKIVKSIPAFIPSTTYTALTHTHILYIQYYISTISSHTISTLPHYSSSSTH